MTQNMIFITVQEFKTRTGAETIDFVESESTGKTFALAGGAAYKSEQVIDGAKPIRFMYSDVEGFTNGCFINVNPPKAKFSI